MHSKDLSPSDWLDQQRAKRTRFRTSHALDSANKRSSILRNALGVDFSLTKSGLAVSSMGLAPRPLMVMKMPHRHVEAAARMVELAQKEGCDGFVVGVPVTRAGNLADSDTDSQVGRRCRNFAYTLALVACSHELPVFVVDERYTTMDAEEQMDQVGRKTKFKKRNVDAMAAALVLEIYYRDPSQAVMIQSPGRSDINRVKRAS